MSPRARALLLASVALVAVTCGRRDELPAAGFGDGGGPRIVIQGFAFMPANLEVMPGDVVDVENLDAMPHSVTSQSAPGSYTPGGVAGVSFDTGPFSGRASFTIPASAPHGTVVPYYCSVHRAAMANSGSITVR